MNKVGCVTPDAKLRQYFIQIKTQVGKPIKKSANFKKVSKELK
jgi:hypothetical protein